MNSKREDNVFSKPILYTKIYVIKTIEVLYKQIRCALGMLHER